MTQQAKKPATAKIASAADKISQTAYSAAEQARKSTETVVNISSNAAREMLASSTSGVRDAQAKAYEMGREGIENLAKSADMCSKAVVELVGIARDNLDACIECGNITTDIAKNVSEQIVESCNRSLAEASELSRDALACRTINDFIELQTKAVRNTLDNCFNESNKIFGMWFECCTEALEPFNERVSSASEKLSKIIAA